MKENLFNYVNIKLENIYLLNGMVDDIEKECMNYEVFIDVVGGIDV